MQQKRVTASDFANKVKSDLCQWINDREVAAWAYLLANTTISRKILGKAYKVDPKNIDIRVKKYLNLHQRSLINSEGRQAPVDEHTTACLSSLSSRQILKINVEEKNNPLQR